MNRYLIRQAQNEREMEANISDLLTAKNDKILALEAELKEKGNQIRHLHTTNDTLKRENATLTADKNIWHNACNNLDEQVHILTAQNERLKIQLRVAVNKIAEFIHVESHGEDTNEPA